MQVNYRFSDYHLLVMSKAPEIGRVKTRMQPHLSTQESVNLHIALAQHVIHEWLLSALCPVHFWVGNNITLFQEAILSPANPRAIDCSLHLQPEGDLGDRMSLAVSASMKDNAHGVILVGTDCPFIDKTYLQSAIEALNSGNDVVIGPANDGGYVLLGMNRYYPELFQNITWGSDTVLSETQKIIQTLDLQSCLLAPLVDIDIVDDLCHLDALPNNLAFQTYL
jgi:rSAM/selenodomain-associated transferase 1